MPAPLKVLLTLLAAVLPPAASRICSQQFSAHAHGAAGDGLTVDTDAIQRALDAAAGAAPACAVLRGGVFVSGTLRLPARVTLYIDSTAVLKASLDAADFQRDSADWPGQAVLVSGSFADGAAVAGGGAIDGQAPMFVTSLDGPSDQLRFGVDDVAYPGIDRVRLVEFKHSKSVSVRDVTLQDSTGFHLHFLNCSGVLVDGVTVNGDLRWPNNDGIDVTSCNDTTIRNCFVQTGDDAFSPKTWQGYGPLHNLTIENCRFRARSGGIHFGASAWYDYVNVRINNVVVIDAHSGLLAQVRGPGSIRNLTVTNFLVSKALFNAPCKPWMGNANPIAISADRWCGGPAPCDKPGTITGLVFENVTAQAENGIFISGRAGGVSHLQMKSIQLVLQQRPPNNGSFGPCPTRQYWPTSDPPGWYNETDLSVSGVFVEHATDVLFDGLSVSFVGSPKPGNDFGECLAIDERTTRSVTVAPGTLRCLRGGGAKQRLF